MPTFSSLESLTSVESSPGSQMHHQSRVIVHNAPYDQESPRLAVSDPQSSELAGHSSIPVTNELLAANQVQKREIGQDRRDSLLPRTGRIEDTVSNVASTRRASQSGQASRFYDCHLCGWRFTLKGNLAAHIRRHTGEKPFECTLCMRRFTQSSLLTVHMRTHTGEKPFVCTICQRCFSRSGNLRTHMRTHTDVKPYECSYCLKRFAQRVNMELHTRVHTGVKPYRCGVCDRAFTSCSNMRRHWRQLHPDYPEPAMGTTQLRNGLPEKALYTGTTSQLFSDRPYYAMEDKHQEYGQPIQPDQQQIPIQTQAHPQAHSYHDQSQHMHPVPGVARLEHQGQPMIQPHPQIPRQSGQAQVPLQLHQPSQPSQPSHQFQQGQTSQSQHLQQVPPSYVYDSQSEEQLNRGEYMMQVVNRPMHAAVPVNQFSHYNGPFANMYAPLPTSLIPTLSAQGLPLPITRNPYVDNNSLPQYSYENMVVRMPQSLTTSQNSAEAGATAAAVPKQDDDSNEIN